MTAWWTGCPVQNPKRVGYVERDGETTQYRSRGTGVLWVHPNENRVPRRRHQYGHFTFLCPQGPFSLLAHDGHLVSAECSDEVKHDSVAQELREGGA
jgi:hypothetical protein